MHIKAILRAIEETIFGFLDFWVELGFKHIAICLCLLLPFEILNCTHLRYEKHIEFSERKEHNKCAYFALFLQSCSSSVSTFVKSACGCVIHWRLPTRNTGTYDTRASEQGLLAAEQLQSPSLASAS